MSNENSRAPGRPRRGRGPRRAGGPARRPPPARHDGPIEPLHPSADPPDIRSFHDWALAPEVLGVIDSMGISTPTPIQRLAIQPVLDGRDVIAKAETGTGKTLAFGAPILSRIDPARASVLALVLCPTRELAQQVCGVLTELGLARGVRTALVVGGEPMHEQIAALKAGAQVVVGTPGRVLDLYGQGFLSFPWTEYAVLDEADEMLEIGFLDDVKKILSFTPDERQTLHFSATFPHDVLQLARESTRDPVEIATAKGVATVDTIEQSFIRVGDDERPRALRTLIEASDPEDVFLVFCGRRTEVDTLMRVMERMPFATRALHGGFDQPARFRVMSAFRGREVKALVATDVASRGLDVLHVSHVVNFSVPQDVEEYTHRIGRTGRAGRAGKAITLVTPRGERDWRDIVRSAPWEIPEAELPARGPWRDRHERRGPGREGQRSRHDRRPGHDRPQATAHPETPRQEPARRVAEPNPTAHAGKGAGRDRRKESTRERVARERTERSEVEPGPERPRERRGPKPAGDSAHSGFGSGL